MSPHLAQTLLPSGPRRMRAFRGKRDHRLALHASHCGAETTKASDLQSLSRWAHLGSNQGPPACEAGALPLSYAPGRKPRRLEGMLSAAASRP